MTDQTTRETSDTREPESAQPFTAEEREMIQRNAAFGMYLAGSVLIPRYEATIAALSTPTVEGSGRTEGPLAKDDPRMVAWEAYTATPEYANAKRWAVEPAHTEGSLWAAFTSGFEASAPSPTAARGVIQEEIARRAERHFEEAVDILTQVAAGDRHEVVADARAWLAVHRRRFNRGNLYARLRAIGTAARGVTGLEARLAEIEARANAASDGPWARAEGCNISGEPNAGSVLSAHWMHIAKIEADGYRPAEDAAFIAHAREDVPWLIEQVRTLLSAAEQGERDRALLESEQETLFNALEAWTAEVSEAHAALIALANEFERRSIPFVPEAEAAVANARSAAARHERMVERGLAAAMQVFEAKRAAQSRQEGDR